ncbi:MULTISPECIES: hypothetical protein [Chelativorans]|uniref:Uncharacterized protein n=1 Tax=Chelativorans sp. (strain BNC1) TaxID=266779 RepID=Q11N83_CHESB
MKPVSASTERALRAALIRLVSGNAARTDGRLTIAGLAREAGVSRATANRAPVILAELRRVAEAAKLSRLEEPRSPQNATERDRRERENVVAQHIQARALLHRADERRIGARMRPLLYEIKPPQRDVPSVPPATLLARHRR